MNQARWMWYPGDFEIHHALKLNCRREERGFRWPAYWRQDDCWHNVRFRHTAVITEPETVTATGNGAGYLMADGKKVPYGTSVPLAPGEHTLEVTAARSEGLPCVYVTGAVFAGGPGWLADHLVGNWLPAGYSDMYTRPEDDPEVFRFSYQEIQPVSRELRQGGLLLDFGRETFAQVRIQRKDPSGGLRICYGESETEALDVERCYLQDAAPPGCRDYAMHARAFRYLYFPGTGPDDLSVTTRYECLPLEYRGSFRCSDERLNQIWDTAAYTFHLNSREFFLDGVKRDRWIWSGDAYQSYLINYYLFFDPDLVRRTTIALRGKDPVEQHLNTILDYSLYWLMGVRQYHRHTGDLEFVRFLWPRMKTLLDFCLARRNREGFVVGLENDWVFIDWADLDKEGAVCAEQMLLVSALEAAADCAALIGGDGKTYRTMAAELKEKIDTFFWREKLGAYIDSYASGREHVTRHANLFAILFGIAGGNKKKQILDHVVNNPAVPPITTPYFQFYELEALCATDQNSEALQRMLSYWGGMLDLGATTIWEEFDPAMDGAQHYAMYGDPYGKSLCHAWGASPVYLLGRYFLGVFPTSNGYETFTCAPDLGGLKWIEGTVPIQGGSVSVSAKDGVLRVLAERDGGTLLWQGQRHPLPLGTEVKLPLA